MLVTHKFVWSIRKEADDLISMKDTISQGSFIGKGSTKSKSESDAGIDLMADYLFTIHYFATSLSLLVPRSHRPYRLINFDFKRIIFTLSIERSN